MANLTSKQKKDFARQLYLDGSQMYSQEEIAERVGISRTTLSRWINAEKWSELRVSITMTKDQSIKRMYRQLDEILKSIEQKDEGLRFPNSSESDSIKKITASIKDLETETGIDDIISVSIKVIEFVRKFDLEKAKMLTDIFDQFIKSLL